MVVRSAGARIRRLAGILTAVSAGVLALAVGPAAFALQVPVSGHGDTGIAPVPATTVRVVTTGGMPGWEITLIALAAALLAAAATVLLARVRAARQTVSAASA